MVWRLQETLLADRLTIPSPAPRPALMIGSRPVQAIYSSDEALSVHVGGMFHVTA